MSGRVLRFSELHVSRVPGVLPGGQFTLRDLSPDVNLIFGPNGSGKTLAGRSLLALIWPGHTRLMRPTLSGTWMLDDHQWVIDLDGGHPAWRKDGASADPPALPPGESQSHHWLGLKELLVDDGSDGQATDAFAQRISREMLGGYDLDAAALALGFSDHPPRPRNDLEAYQAERSAVEAARSNERALHQRAEELDVLQQRSAAAKAADETVRRLERALEHRDATNHFVQLERDLAEYDDALSKLHGDESTQLENLHAKRRTRVIEQTDARHRLEEAEAAQSSTTLPADGVPGNTVTALDCDTDTLTERTRDLADARDKMASLTADRDARRTAIGDTISDDVLISLRSVPTEQMERHATDTTRHHIDRARLDARKCEIEKDCANIEQEGSNGTDPTSLDTVRRGHDALSHWLATPAPDGSTGRSWSVPLLVAAGSIAILIIVLGVLNHPAWFVAMVIVGPFVWLARPHSGDAADTDHRSTYQHVYSRMVLAQPNAWTIEAVQSTLEDLTEAWIRLERMAAAQQQLKNSKKQCERIDEEVAATADRLTTEREAIESVLGFAFDTERDDWLHVLGANLAAWHKAHSETAACGAQIEQIEHDIEKTLRRFNESLRPYLDDSRHDATEASEARGLQRDLATRIQRHRTARQEMIAAQRDLEHATTEIERIDGDSAALFTRIGLESGDETSLNRWLEQLDRYCTLKQDVRDARSPRDRLAEQLSEYPHLLECDQAALESDLERAQREAGELVGIEQEIGGITREIDNAKRAHSVEDAMRRVDGARVTLLRDRENAEQAVVGDAIVGWLRAEASDRTQPAVMRKAVTFFQRITHGRFELRLVEEGGTATFAAWDTRDEMHKSLDQLSAGERVQLLLSVRLGFLEQDEAGVRLPIILDETLGTTDDERAGAIIDAVVEICRAGRQVFYFTAQPDEVGKWVSRLEATTDVTLKEIDLARLRHLAEADATPLVIRRPEQSAVPEPEDLNHAAYGTRLGVPGLNPVGTVGAVHLWHIIDDPSVLHTLLERRVRSWGPFEYLMSTGGWALPGIDRVTIDRSQSRARAIQAAFDAWRIGRGRPVDRTVLEESGAVSAAFTDRITELATSCHGDASSIVAALEDGQISRWRSNNTDQLRTFLEDHGFLDRESPLGRDEIHHRVLIAVGHDIETRHIDNAWIDRMIASLPDVRESEARFL